MADLEPIDGNNFKINQHYVPQTYLKYFANMERKEYFSFVYLVRQKKIKYLPIKKLCIERELYETKYYMQAEDTWVYESPNYIENYFMNIEGAYDNHIQDLITKCSTASDFIEVTENEKDYFASFMSMILFRNPVIVKLVKKYTDYYDFSGVYEKLRLTISDLDVSYEDAKNFIGFEYLKHIYEIEDGKSLVNVIKSTFINDSFCILRAQSQKFITCDMPVSNLYGEVSESNYDMVGMAISPDYYIAFLDREGNNYFDGKIFDIDDEKVRRINNSLIKNIEPDFLFAQRCCHLDEIVKSI